MPLLQNSQIKAVAVRAALLVIGMVLFLACLLLASWLVNGKVVFQMGPVGDWSFSHWRFDPGDHIQLGLLAASLFLAGALVVRVTRLQPVTAAFWLANPWMVNFLVKPANMLAGSSGGYNLWWAWMAGFDDISITLLLCFLSAWTGAALIHRYLENRVGKGGIENVSSKESKDSSLPESRATMLFALSVLLYSIVGILEESWMGRIAVAILGAEGPTRDAYPQEHPGFVIFGFVFFFVCFLLVGLGMSRLLGSRGVIFAFLLASPWAGRIASEIYMRSMAGIHETLLFSHAPGYFDFVASGELLNGLTLVCFLAVLAGSHFAQRKPSV